ncbi:MAG: ATP-binding cassette domain-containing protein [Terrimicrobiaceae bacterium]|jgi:ABC-type lipoprotein export system ATPase subunit
MTAIICENLSCSKEDWYGRGPVSVGGISITIEAGEFIGLCGPDGSGKGLLLNLIGLLERPDAGSIFIAGQNTGELDPDDLATFRNEACGYLFGHPYLLPSFSVAENVAMPLFRICGGEARDARQRTLEVLTFVGIPDFETSLAGRVPPSVRWRAAFARAIVHAPGILIAISPPSDNHLLALAGRAVRELGITVLWAGERSDLVPIADRIIDIRDGRCVE